MKENFGFIFPTICSLNDIRKVLAYNRRWQGARAGQISNVDLVLLSRPTGMDPSQTSFFQLLGIGTKMVGPGASEIVLDLASVALVDGASVFFAFDTDAFTLSSTGGVALVSPANFNVVAPDSEEPIEDLLFPNVGSTSDVPSNIAFDFNDRIVVSTDRSKMIRITTGGMEVVIPSGQGDRVHVPAPGSSVSVDLPSDLAYGSDVSVVVDEGAFLDMSGHETGLRFRPLPSKLCLVRVHRRSHSQCRCRP